MFRPFVDEQSLFVPTRSPRPVGTRQPFLIQLRDGQVMLRGQGEVIESFPEGPGSKRVGMRMRILSLDPASQELHTRILQHKRASTLPPPFRGGVTPTVRFLVPPIPSGEAPPAGARTETRAPGASYTLPANPFSELPSEALEHFIDCTIYEDTGAPPERPGAAPLSLSSSQGSLSTSTPSSARTEGTERVTVQPVGPPPRRSAALVAAVSVGAATVGLMGGYLLWARPGEPPPRRAPATTAVVTTPAPTPVEAKPAPPEPAPSEPAPAAPPAPAPEAAPAPAPAAVAPVAEAKPSEPEPAAAVPTLAVAAPAPRPADVPVAPPSPNDCVASFVTDPDGADVTVNGLDIGRTPIAGAVVPCGPLVLGFTHARYERVEQKVTVAAGSPVDVRQRLVRPEATLEIVSAPPGATILVHGENIGRAPARLKLDSFTTYKITATLEGHKVWSQSVYVKGKAMTVTARLDPMDEQRPRWRPGPTLHK